MIHIVKVFGIVNKAKVDVFLELPCFFDNPADVGNLISGSSAFLSYVRRVHPAKCWAWMKHKMELIFAGTNINKLIYADDTILMAEREELKSLLMKVKE